MARLRTQDRGRIEWFELVDQFDVGPASAGSARLLESRLNGPVMRITRDWSVWKALAFPGTGYDIVVDQALVHPGSPRTVVDGSSIQILQAGAVKVDATFQDAEQLEERVASLARECHGFASRLAAREAQLEAARAETNPLKQRLVTMEGQRRLDEVALFKLWTELDAMRGEHEHALAENHDLRAECARLNAEREHRRWKEDHQAAEIQRLRSSLASVEMLLRSTQDNAISQGNHQDNAIEELKHRLGELEKERDRLLQMKKDGW